MEKLKKEEVPLILLIVILISYAFAFFTTDFLIKIISVGVGVLIAIFETISLYKERR